MKTKKNLSYLFCAVFFLIAWLAAYPRTAAAQAQLPTPVISNINANYKAVTLEIQNMDLEKYTCDIYRADSKNGTYKRQGTIEKNGVLWFDMGGYQCVLDRKGRVLYGINGNAVTYTDYTVSYHKTYYYKVQFSNGWANAVSEYSNVVSCRSALDKPSFTRAYAAGGKANLKWSKTEGADGYILYRKNTGKWKKYKTFSKNTFEYTDSSVKNGSSYSYRLLARRKIKGKNTYSPYSDTCKISFTPAKVPGDYKSGSVYGPSLSSRQLEEVRQVAQSFKTNFIKKGMSDYEKVKIAHDYLCVNCSYAYEGGNYIHTALGALVYGKAQCSGYSRAMKALCDAIGIPCYYVRANAQSANPSHQWNQVKVDGKWYIVDVQANDSSGFYAYFLVSGDSYSSSSGMRWDTASLPATSKKNYSEIKSKGK